MSLYVTFFQPFGFSSVNDSDEMHNYLDIACQMDLPIKHISPNEVKQEIVQLNDRKSPGYDSINGIVIKNLPKKCIILLTSIFNAILRTNHYPSQWKCGEIIMVPKANKPENELISYRPISLLPTFSKIFEKLFVNRLLPILEERSIIPLHQFGLKHKHGIPEQCHRVINVISESLENKRYCSAVL